VKNLRIQVIPRDDGDTLPYDSGSVNLDARITRIFKRFVTLSSIHPISERISGGVFSGFHRIRSPSQIRR
jgi:hypothetical protein